MDTITRHRRFTTKTNTPNLQCRDCHVHQARNSSTRYSSIYETDEFRMYTFKVVICQKKFYHDWTSCPFTHYGERARRRDPSTYLPVLCPFFKDDESCRRGKLCKFAHGIFEYYLHPGRYRTSKCTNGTSCDRKVCFFAHTENELRDEMLLSSEDIYSAFSSNANTPVAIAPRQVLKALAAHTSSNNYKKIGTSRISTSTDSSDEKNIVTPAADKGVNNIGTADLSAKYSNYAGEGSSSNANSNYAGEGSSSNANSNYAGPSTLSLELSPASIWSTALSSWPSDFSGFAGLLEQIGDSRGAVDEGSSTGQNSDLDEDAAVSTREYRLWN